MGQTEKLKKKTTNKSRIMISPVQFRDREVSPGVAEVLRWELGRKVKKEARLSARALAEVEVGRGEEDLRCKSLLMTTRESSEIRMGFFVDWCLLSPMVACLSYLQIETEATALGELGLHDKKCTIHILSKRYIVNALLLRSHFCSISLQ